jgi:hypothetical protein
MNANLAVNKPEGVAGVAPVQAPAQAEEQLLYAALLTWGTRLGLLVLLLGFGAYVTGWVSPHVPLERLPELWSQPVAQYLAQTHTPTGWGWMALLNRSDMLSMAGIAILAGCSVPCLLALVPLYASRGDKAFVAVCLADAAVVLVAASGWLTGGH